MSNVVSSLQSYLIENLSTLWKLNFPGYNVLTNLSSFFFLPGSFQVVSIEEIPEKSCEFSISSALKKQDFHRTEEAVDKGGRLAKGVPMKFKVYQATGLQQEEH